MIAYYTVRDVFLVSGSILPAGIGVHKILFICKITHKYKADFVTRPKEVLTHRFNTSKSMIHCKNL